MIRMFRLSAPLPRSNFAIRRNWLFLYGNLLVIQSRIMHLYHPRTIPTVASLNALTPLTGPPRKFKTLDVLQMLMHVQLGRHNETRMVFLFFLVGERREMRHAP
jgi:hypothetical protein